MNFGFIGSPVITMFHQVIYGEIVTIMLKPVGEVLVYWKTVSFFSGSVFIAQLRLSHFAQRVFFCVLCVQFRKDHQFGDHIWSSVKALEHKKNIP